MIVVLLILIPLLTGLAAFFFKDQRSVRFWALFSSVITLVVSLLSMTLLKDPQWISFHAAWMESLGSSFSIKLDGLGQMLCLLTAVSYPLIFLATWQTSYRNAKQFFALMLLAQAGLMGVFLSMDALLFYFFWELALIPMYFLCSQWGGEKRIAVTFKFFIYTFVGSILMLVAIIFVHSMTPDNSFSIESFYSAAIPHNQQDLLFWLFFLAFAIKMPIFPFHSWQPDTYEQSPPATTMVLSGVMVKMGVLGLIRWLLPVLPMASWAWGNVVTSMAIVGMLYASLIAIRQDNLRRLVAYSSIAHMGLMCAAIFSVDNLGLQGVMIQLFNHGINIIGLWIVVDWIEKTTGTRKISELGGLAQRAPALTILLVIVALANIGLPLTNAFPGEFLMFSGIMGSKATIFYAWFTAFAGLTIILAAVYMLNMIRKVFYGEGNSLSAGIRDIGWNEKFALGILVAIIFALGVYPQFLLNMTEEISGFLLGKTDVLHLIKK
ncbi:MAG TPA: NADH-quinone oxidoreductase subunit M [Chitinophagaceae bacterium]|nr:NADH-quinone oxidoreductase subunit M [Chitinophagaceae bacterium]